MTGLYSKQRINFHSTSDSDLPRYEYHRTVRAALGLSATSYSQQLGNNGLYQWDNIAPEIALVILQDAKKEGINIQDEVIEKIGMDSFNETRLQKALDKLHSNRYYSLFIQKLALHITGKETVLTLESLKRAGITTIDQLDEVFNHFFQSQEKLAKDFPNFSKIDEDDDYLQFITYLATEPLFEPFLQSFTQNLASQFNLGKKATNRVEKPQNMDAKSLLKFFQSISYDLTLKSPDIKQLKENTLYLELVGTVLHYTVKSPNGELVTAFINPGELNFTFDEKTTEEELKRHLPAILRVTAQRGHTGTMALNNTATLRDEESDFLASDIGASLFLSHLPAIDLIKDEGHKFTLYQWLSQGNLTRLKDFLVAGACQRYKTELDDQIERIKEPSELNEEFKVEVDAVAGLIKEITDLVTTLEDNPNEHDSELDKKIARLIVHLTKIKEHYNNTPLLKPGADFPSTSGNFEDFVKIVLFNSAGNKNIQYITDSIDKNKTWKINLIQLANAATTNNSFINVRDVKNKKDHSMLTDENGHVIPPAIALREQMKNRLTMSLKNNIHHYHTLQSYENDNLNTTQAPVVFRGGNLTDSLSETKFHAKKLTLLGEYSADSHLLAGQENNIKKHEVRSGTATTLASTGVAGTRSFTDKFDVALKYGGMKDIKILYIVRGKKAFHSQPFAEITGKTKLSEIAYTHVNPSDYIMTILYDKNNVILDVIPGNLNGEIQEISDVTKEIIAKGIEFYNQKHDTSQTNKHVIKLPQPIEQKTGLEQLPKPKSLIDMIHMHKIDSDSPAETSSSTNKLGCIRITQSIPNSHKVLSVETLRTEIEATKPLSSTWDLPIRPFKSQPGRLEEVRKSAVAHFNMRHVLTLKGYSSWSIQEKKLQETYNRILQPDFMDGILTEQLGHAQIAHEDWLTDILVPKMKTALMLHIAARLITDYRIDVEAINPLAQKIFNQLIESTHIYSQLTDVWNNVHEESNTKEVIQLCVQKAKDKMLKIYPSLSEGSHEYETRFNSCLLMEKNKVRKQLLNKATSDFLDSHMEDIAQKEKLEKKPVYLLANNRDFVFLGAAASGKSTISSQYIQKEERLDFVSLATDDYRSICMPYTELFEKEETDQVFIRTQDSAYMVSELVEERLHAKQIERPNVIVDGVTYKPSQRALIEKNSNSTIVCACLDDVSLVVKRSYDRAIQEESSSADKGRYVNTSSLINMHKTASLNLLIFCPSNIKLAFYNTNIPRGSIPPLVATVDTHGDKVLTIQHDNGSLMTLASFFNKARVNVGAKNEDNLFLNKLKRPEFQIDSLFAVMDYGYKIVLNGAQGTPCLSVKKESNGEVRMDIIDPQQLKDKIEHQVTEKSLLQMLILYGQHGNLKEVQKECLIHGNIDLMIDQLLDSQMSQEKHTLQKQLNIK